jgi:hypothetical protein
MDEIQEIQAEPVEIPVLPGQSDEVAQAVADVKAESIARGYRPADGETEVSTDQPPVSAPEGSPQAKTDAPFDYESELAELGGADGVRALKTLMASEGAELSNLLGQEQVQSLVWSALNNEQTAQVVMGDPEVQQRISDQWFDGRPLSEVAEALEFLERRSPQENAQRQAQFDRSQAAQKEISQANERAIFVDPENSVHARYGYDQHTRDDVRYSAQGRFLAENGAEYFKLEQLKAQGNNFAATVLQNRLQNKFQALLIDSAERHAGAGRKAAPAKTAPAPAKVAPAAAAKPASKQYDLSSNDWLGQFTKDFAAERKRRGL